MSDSSFDTSGRLEDALRQMREMVAGAFPGSASQQTTDDRVLSGLQKPVAKDPPDSTIGQLVRHPCVILILGHRGSGKTALACRLQELLRDLAPVYAVGLPPRAARLLPTWYGLADDPGDIPSNAIIYLPESYRLFHARETQTAQGRAIGELVNLSRHRRHTLIFDVQNPSHLDRNIISETDVVLVKQPGPLTQGFERPQFRPIMDAARAAFASVGSFRRKRMVWVYAPGEGEVGKLMENQLPTFWTNSLSRVFGDVWATTGATSPQVRSSQRDTERGTAKERRGLRTSLEARREKARRLRQQGHSYSEIGRVLGVGKSQAFRMVNSSKLSKTRWPPSTG